jgi:hypothetical protein
MKQRLVIFFVTMMTVLVIGCRPSVPSDYIQPETMEDVLYDYHLAQAMAMNPTIDEKNTSFNEELYRKAVFKKYGITEAEFDSSMVYYMRHTEQLHGIYEKLAKRFSDDALELGADESEVNKYNVLTNKGDTANIWAGNKSVVLTPQAPFNRLTFDIEADTTFHKGDRFLFNFSAMFLFQDGIKDGVAAIAVKYNNDSVVSQVIHVTSNDKYQINLYTDDSHTIKEINGFIFVGRGGASLTTLKLMFVDNIQIIRFHKNKTTYMNNKSNNSSSPNSPHLQNIESEPIDSPVKRNKPIRKPGTVIKILPIKKDKSN